MWTSVGAIIPFTIVNMLCGCQAGLSFQHQDSRKPYSKQAPFSGETYETVLATTVRILIFTPSCLMGVSLVKVYLLSLDLGTQILKLHNCLQKRMRAKLSRCCEINFRSALLFWSPSQQKHFLFPIYSLCHFEVICQGFLSLVNEFQIFLLMDNINFYTNTFPKSIKSRCRYFCQLYISY